jgi:hypothetical protein
MTYIHSTIIFYLHKLIGEKTGKFIFKIVKSQTKTSKVKATTGKVSKKVVEKIEEATS